AREIFERPVRVKKGDKMVVMRRSEAIFELICQKALSGDDDAIAAFLKIAPKLGYLEPPKQPEQVRTGVLRAPPELAMEEYEQMLERYNQIRLEADRRQKETIAALNHASPKKP